MTVADSGEGVSKLEASNFSLCCFFLLRPFSQNTEVFAQIISCQPTSRGDLSHFAFAAANSFAVAWPVHAPGGCVPEVLERLAP